MVFLVEFLNERSVIYFISHSEFIKQDAAPSPDHDTTEIVCLLFDLNTFVL